MSNGRDLGFRFQKGLGVQVFRLCLLGLSLYHKQKHRQLMTGPFVKVIFHIHVESTCMIRPKVEVALRLCYPRRKLIRSVGNIYIIIASANLPSPSCCKTTIVMKSLLSRSITTCTYILIYFHYGKVHSHQRLQQRYTCLIKYLSPSKSKSTCIFAYYLHAFRGKAIYLLSI